MTTLIDQAFSSNIPRNAEVLAMHCAMSNGTANTTVTTVGIDVISFMVNLITKELLCYTHFCIFKY